MNIHDVNDVDDVDDVDDDPWRLKKFGLSPQFIRAFYRATIESLLTSSFTIWSEKDHKAHHGMLAAKSGGAVHSALPQQIPENYPETCDCVVYKNLYTTLEAAQPSGYNMEEYEQNRQ